MAIAWRISPNTVGFNMDEPEEILLLDAYIALLDNAKETEGFMADIDRLFLTEGKGLSDRLLAQVNDALERCGLPDMRVIPRLSSRTPWMTLRGPQKGDARRKLLDDLRDPKMVAMLLKQARDQVKFLPPAHPADVREQEALFAEGVARITGKPAPQSDAVQPGPAPAFTASGFGEQPDVGDAFPYPRDQQFDRKFPSSAPDPSGRPRGPGGGGPGGADTLEAALRRVEAKLDTLARVEAKLDRVITLLSAADKGAGRAAAG